MVLFLYLVGGGGPPAFNPWGITELADTDIGNEFDPQIMSSPANL